MDCRQRNSGSAVLHCNVPASLFGSTFADRGQRTADSVSIAWTLVLQVITLAAVQRFSILRSIACYVILFVPLAAGTSGFADDNPLSEVLQTTPMT